MSEEKTSWWPYLLVLLVGLAAAPWIIPKMTSPPADPTKLPSGQPDLLRTMIDGKQFIGNDKDGDGALDCLKPVRSAMFTGIDVLYAEGWKGRCSSLDLDERPMPEGLRETITSLARYKHEAGISHGVPIDLDDDRHVDCVVNVHNPEITVERVDGKACPGEMGGEIHSARQAMLDPLLALERQVSEAVAR